VTFERVPDSAVIDGRPQGIFVGRSLLTGRSVCLLFLADGRASRAVPSGGLASFDWARHETEHPGDVGTWALSGGVLTISWGDGGVHSGPLTVNQDSIEFYGKRYARPAAATVAELAGQWEAASGFAIAGGAGINRVSSLTLQADGRYSWADTVGGVVEGLAAAAGSSNSGSLEISGQTATFKADDGSTSEHTFVAVAGQPITAFTLDQETFTRNS
jgi:hypothetical protein